MSADEVRALYEGNAPAAPEVDKNQLLETMLQASRLDSAQLSQTQLEALTDAMAAATTVYENSQATQQEVDQARQALEQAMSAEQPIRGDLNQDGAVNVLDVMVLAQYVVGQSVDITPEDYNNDGEIDLLDVMALAQMAIGVL